jgi:hypothetical protein
MLIDILRQYLAIFSQPRYKTQATIPNGSDVLDCLAFGFAKLTEELQRGDDVLLKESVLQKIHALDGRISQVAVSSKSCSSSTEWELTHICAWELIEELGWDSQGPVPNSSAPAPNPPKP